MAQQRKQTVRQGGPGSSKPDIGVGLTGFAGLDNADVGTSIASALRQAWDGTLRLTAFGDDPMMTGAWLPGAIDRICLTPGLEHGTDALFQTIARAHDVASLDALIPGTNRDALIVARLARRLDSLGIRTLVPAAEQIEAVQPARLIRTLSGQDVRLAPAVIVSDKADISWQAEQIGYPLYVRSDVASKIAFDAAQAERAATQLMSGQGHPLVLQRRIDGDEFAVAMIVGFDGTCVAQVVRRSLALNGEARTVAGVVVDDPAVAQFALDVLAKLDWRGSIDMTVVKEPGTKQLWLAAVRCHLPSWCMLSHWAGTNLPYILLRHIVPGRHPAKRQPKTGTMYLRGVAEAGVPLDDFARLCQGGDIARPVNGSNGVPHCGANGSGRSCLRVAVSGISSYDVINPGLGVARALRESERVSKVYGLTYGTFDSGAYQPDLFDAAFLLSNKGSADRLLARVGEIHASHPFDILIPCLDGELPVYQEIAGALRDLGVRTLLPSRDSLQRRDKLSLFGGRFKRDWEAFEIPASQIARSEAETVTAVRETGVLAVVKGPVSHCIPVATEGDARQAWCQFSGYGEKSVIVQPRITGPAYAISVVCNRDNEAESMLTIRKTAICERGSTWGAIHVREPELEQSFARFLRAIKWVGPGEGEFLRDEVTNRFYLIEVNPRFTGWAYYSAVLGSNQPYLAACLAMGEDVKAPDNDRSVIFVRGSKEIPLRASQVAALSTKGILQHG